MSRPNTVCVVIGNTLMLWSSASKKVYSCGGVTPAGTRVRRLGFVDSLSKGGRPVILSCPVSLLAEILRSDGATNRVIMRLTNH